MRYRNRIHMVSGQYSASGQEMTYKHKDPTNHGFWNPPRLGPSSQRISVFMPSLGAPNLGSWALREGSGGGHSKAPLGSPSCRRRPSPDSQRVLVPGLEISGNLRQTSPQHPRLAAWLDFLHVCQPLINNYPLRCSQTYC